MRILIAGAGTIGVNLAASLAREGQEVVVIDTDESRLESLQSRVDCQTRTANATSPLVLEEMGIRHTDLVVAVTQSDAENLMICQLAEFYRVREKLARVRNPEFFDPESIIPSTHFGVDHFISPEGISVDQMERLVRCPGSTEAIDFAQHRFYLRALPVSDDCPLAGEQLMTVHRKLGRGFLIAAIRRGSRMLIPQGQETLRIGDSVYIATTPENIDHLTKAFVPQARPAHKVVIFGAGVTGVELARRLSSFLQRVILLDDDPSRARHAAEILDPLGVEVLQGSALDEALLARCHIETADFFIALSDDEEENFMGALLSRKYTRGIPIVLTNQPHYVDIFEQAGLDIVINPRLLAVSAILRHIRSHAVMSVAKLYREETEILEFKVPAKSPITREPLRGFTMAQRGFLVMAVLRGRELVIPGGDYQVAPGDRVLVLADRDGISAAEAMFR